MNQFSSSLFSSNEKETRMIPFCTTEEIQDTVQHRNKRIPNFNSSTQKVFSLRGYSGILVGATAHSRNSGQFTSSFSQACTTFIDFAHTHERLAPAL